MKFNFFVFLFVTILTTNFVYSQSKDKKIKDKKYLELESRIKETNNALTELNRKLSDLESRLKQIDKKLHKQKQNVRISTTTHKANVSSLRQDISNLEIEILLLRKELARLQEKAAVRKIARQDLEQQTEQTNSSKSKFKKIISSPWITIGTLIIATLALII